MAKQKTFELGDQLVDIVTGFKGTATGRVTYLTGCDQYLLTPKAKKGKLGNTTWFDVTRLQLVEGKKRVTLPDSSDKGADVPAPIK